MRTTMPNFAKTLALFAVAQLATLSKAQLAARIDSSASGGLWTYSIFNDEASGSSLYLSTLDLTLGAPIADVSSPAGWDFLTDYATYVSWFNEDALPPYEHDVAPGNSLSGFSFTSASVVTTLAPASIASWDHALDAPGDVFSGSALVPMAVPEPAALASLALGLLAFSVRTRRRS